MVTHVAVTRPVNHLALAIVGNAFAVGLMALAAVLGWAAALAAFPQLKTAISLVGGSYLLYFGVRMVLRAVSVQRNSGVFVESAGEAEFRPHRSFALGFFTALSNAQALFFITSVLAAAGVIGAGLATGVVCAGIIVTMNLSYLTMIGWLLQRPAARATYFQFRHYLECLFGLLFVGFGLRLVWREWTSI